ncbi:methyl-accepting chemotaxis protein [Methyloterricola oryzae]|uniref:methyl-accepting chemotaxis protein n=1 Tax=Methyloterricola oryzae TaxID=1495050 RepID=UPI0005EB4E5D|nr:methyl-accepting chemotaxis protein [Methyloterricola oryzae]
MHTTASEGMHQILLILEDTDGVDARGLCARMQTVGWEVQEITEPMLEALPEARQPAAWMRARVESGGPVPTCPVEKLGACREQLQSARTETREKVTALAARFSSLINLLQAAHLPGGGEDGAQDSAADAMERSSRELEALMDTLEQIRKGRLGIAEDIAGMRRYIAELTDMSAQMANIAMQTNLLAMNAAIEVAHAAESGKGFAVVIEEVRKLSAHTAETSQKMNHDVRLVADALKNTSQVSAEWTRRDAAVVSETETAVSKVLGNFSEISKGLHMASQILHEAHARVGDDISEVLVSLQFEDRIAQILEHVMEHMQELQRLLGDETAASELASLDASAWLDRMKQSYTTQEQHYDHVGASQESPADSDITFF